MFYFPGLTAKAWHDPHEFAWTRVLEANKKTIQDEYLALKAIRAKSRGASDYNVNDKEHQLHQGKWDWLSYVTQGNRQAEFAVHCPKTTEILESIPEFMTGLPFAYSFFSALQPQVRTKDHLMCLCVTGQCIDGCLVLLQ